MNKSTQFKEEVSKYINLLHPDYPQPKCLSDQGLLWLRYGIWKLGEQGYLSPTRPVYGGTVDSKLALIEEDRGEKFEDFCIRLYNDNIRGNMDYTNRPMIPAVAALLYIACVVYGVPAYQSEIAEIYRTTEGTLRKYYHDMRDLIDNGEIKI